MNIRRLEVLAMSALFLVVLAALPFWQKLGHLTSEAGCLLVNTPSVVAADYSLAFQLKNLPTLIFGILLVAFGLSLLFGCWQKKGSQKEMYTCATCSTPYEYGSKFCHSCGAEL